MSWRDHPDWRERIALAKREHERAKKKTPKKPRRPRGY